MTGVMTAIATTNWTEWTAVGGFAPAIASLLQLTSRR